MISKNEILKLVPPKVKLGFYLLDTETQQHLEINADDPFPLASISKLITAVAVLSQNDQIAPTVVLDTVAKHCNHSYQQLLNEVSVEGINRWLKELNVNVKMDADNRNKVSNCGTPRGLAELIHLLLKGELLDIDSTQLILTAFEKQSDPDGFRFNKNHRWFHMTGGLDGVCNDVGLFEVNNRTFIVVGLVEAEDTETRWEQLEQTLQEIGSLLMKNIEL